MKLNKFIKDKKKKEKKQGRLYRMSSLLTYLTITDSAEDDDSCSGEDFDSGDEGGSFFAAEEVKEKA
jgi:hypothetical protein